MLSHARFLWGPGGFSYKGAMKRLSKHALLSAGIALLVVQPLGCGGGGGGPGPDGSGGTDLPTYGSNGGETTTGTPDATRSNQDTGGGGGSVAGHSRKGSVVGGAIAGMVGIVAFISSLEISWEINANSSFTAQPLVVVAAWPACCSIGGVAGPGHKHSRGVAGQGCGEFVASERLALLRSSQSSSSGLGKPIRPILLAGHERISRSCNGLPASTEMVSIKVFLTP